MGQSTSKQNEGIADTMTVKDEKACIDTTFTFDNDAFERLCSTNDGTVFSESVNDQNLCNNVKFIVDPGLKEKICKLHFASDEVYKLDFSNGKPSSCGLCTQE